MGFAMTDRYGYRRFRPGETAVVRYITRQGSQPGMSWPYHVIEDSDELVALYIPAGATYMRWGSPPPGQARGSLEPAEWRRDVLRLMLPGRQHSTWLFWSHEEGRRGFSAYYVNLEEPFRRTGIGFDTNDHTLDIVVTPALQWRWKDEEQFEALVRSGQYSAEFARSVRAEGEEMVRRIEGRLPPFGDGWEAFEPDPAWGLPELPAGWYDEPVAPWERRAWAYGGT